MRSCIISTFSRLMFLKASVDVGCDAAVERFVRAEEEVDGVRGHKINITTQILLTILTINPDSLYIYSILDHQNEFP